MKKILTMILVSVFAAAIPADLSAKRNGNEIEVKGKVIDMAGNAMPFVTVAIMNNDGSVVAGATSADDGSYVMKLVPEAGLDRYFLYVSFVGYKDILESLEMFSSGEAVNSVLKLKDIRLEEDATVLASALVTEKRPLLEHKFDKIVMNVSELAAAQTGNAIDVLKSAPGVTIDKDGNVKLNGQSVAVWIDGRPSNMSGKDLESFLKANVGTNIEKVEIMMNPSSKYDAEGSSGVINIKTKKGFMKGLNGSLGATMGLNFSPWTSLNGNVNANIFYKTDKTNTNFVFSPSHSPNNIRANEQKIYGEDHSLLQNNDTDYKSAWTGHYIGLSNDWYISKKDILGVSLKTNISRTDNPEPGEGDIHNRSVLKYYINQGTPEQSLWSVINGTVSSFTRGQYYAANANYTHTFDESKAQELTLNADYSYNSSDSKSSQKNYYDLSQCAPEAIAGGELNDFGYDQTTDRALNLVSFKADYSQIFWKSTGRIEAGLKAAVSMTDNSFRKEMWSEAATKAASGIQTDDFFYNEQVYAAYFNISKQFSPKWSAQLGLRGEMTVVNASWEVKYPHYFKLFPTAFVTYMPSQKAILSLNYSRRLSRPKYWQMNPFKEYFNATTYNQGDPAMTPSFTNTVNLNGVFWSRFVVNLGYSNTTQYTGQQYPVWDTNTGELGLLWGNSGTFSMAYASISLSELPITRWWNITVNLNGNYNMFKANPDLESTGYSKDHTDAGFTMVGYLSTSFFLPKNFKIGADAWGMTPMTQGFSNVETMGAVNFSLIKTLWDSKGTLSLNINDPFNLSKISVFAESQGVKAYKIRQLNTTRGFTLGFNWRFGQNTAKQRRNVGKLDEESRM